MWLRKSLKRCSKLKFTCCVGKMCDLEMLWNNGNEDVLSMRACILCCTSSSRETLWELTQLLWWVYSVWWHPSLSPDTPQQSRCDKGGGGGTGLWETPALQLWGLTVRYSVNHVFRVVSPLMFRSLGVFSTPPFCPTLSTSPPFPACVSLCPPSFAPTSSSCLVSMQH